VGVTATVKSLLQLGQGEHAATTGTGMDAPLTDGADHGLELVTGAVPSDRRLSGDSSIWRPDDLSDPGERVSPPLRRMLVAADLIALGTGWVVGLGAALRLAGSLPSAATLAAQTALVLGIGVLVMSASGLYRRQICAIRAAEIARIGRTSLALSVVAAVLLIDLGRDAAGAAALAGGVMWFSVLAVERGLFREWIHGRRAIGDFSAPMLVVGGSAASAVDLARFLTEHPVLGFHVQGIVCPPSLAAKQAPFTWLGSADDVQAKADRARAAGVVIDARSLTGDELSDTVRHLSSTNLHVHISSGLRGVDRRRITVSPLADETFLHVAPVRLSHRQLAVKRGLDLTLGSVALVVLGPVLLLAALGIWLYDRGPVFFTQVRIGKDGRPFRLYKLRTMVVDAEQRRGELEDANLRGGPLFKVVRDPRVTPLGRFLRTSSIDEIPQLFNVLQGVMSLVGPRPALPDEVQQFDDRLNERLAVKPGVTGLWQVEARDLESFELYRRYDLLYVQSWSVGLDLAIVARTVTVVLVRTLTALLPSSLVGRRVHTLE
jgi:exopolysaccharide biosynthesis polyprenyl glycosylphosphotransferase